MIRPRIRKYGFTEAISALAPGAIWSMIDEDYNQLKWVSNDIPKPTISELQSKVDELNAAEPLRVVRECRDKLLTETDWIPSKYYDLGEPVPEEWKAYRQALRDLPNTSTPVLDSTSPTGISGVNWPVKPEINN